MTLGALKGMAETVQADLFATLADLQRKNRESYDLCVGPAELLNAEQNAQVVVSLLQLAAVTSPRLLHLASR